MLYGVIWNITKKIIWEVVMTKSNISDIENNFKTVHKKAVFLLVKLNFED